MKIGIVTQAFYPYPGGVSEHVYHTARVLRQMGHDVRVVTTSFPGDPPDCEAMVRRIGRAVSVPVNGSFCPVAVCSHMKRAVRAMLDAERFDVLHLHEPLMPTLCRSVLSQAEAPVVGTFHASSDSRVAHTVAGRALGGLAGRLAKRIAVSRAAEATASQYTDGEFTIVPNGVDVERFRDAEPIRRLRDGRFNILFVGRMEPRKGAKFLFRALPAILREVPEARLVVVGGGPLSSYYRRYVPRECEPNVLFEGFVHGSMLPRYYRTADVFCSPATYGESFGIVLLEAMAAGAAIVASDIPGYRDVIGTGERGILVPRKSPEAIADAIVGLARDPGFRNTLSRRGRRDVERYSWDRVTREILDVYRTALDREVPDEGRSGTSVERERRVRQEAEIVVR